MPIRSSDTRTQPSLDRSHITRQTSPPAPSRLTTHASLAQPSPGQRPHRSLASAHYRPRAIPIPSSDSHPIERYAHATISRPQPHHSAERPHTRHAGAFSVLTPGGCPHLAAAARNWQDPGGGSTPSEPWSCHSPAGSRPPSASRPTPLPPADAPGCIRHGCT